MRKPRAPRRVRLAPVADRSERRLGLPHLENVWPEVCRRCDCAHCQMVRGTDVVEVDATNVVPVPETPTPFTSAYTVPCDGPCQSAITDGVVTPDGRLLCAHCYAQE